VVFFVHLIPRRDGFSWIYALGSEDDGHEGRAVPGRLSHYLIHRRSRERGSGCLDLCKGISGLPRVDAYVFVDFEFVFVGRAPPPLCFPLLVKKRSEPINARGGNMWVRTRTRVIASMLGETTRTFFVDASQHLSQTFSSTASV